MGLYKSGTIAVTTGGAATGTGTDWAGAGNGIRVGQTILINSNPAQQFTIQAINNSTSLNLLPAPASAIPAGTTYAILTTDALSVDGLASQVAEAITYFKTSLSGRAGSGVNSDITSLTGLTTPLSVSQGGTGGNSQAAGRSGLGLGTAAVANIGTGSGQVPDMSSFGIQKNGTSGWQKLPSGLIVQWGQVTVGASGAFNPSLAIPFPAACAQMALTIYDDFDSGARVWRRTSPSPLSNVQFGLTGGNQYTAVSWIVFGW